MKLKIQSPIVYEKSKKRFVTINCFHCGKEYEIFNTNMRVDNYCEGCK